MYLLITVFLFSFTLALKGNSASKGYIGFVSPENKISLGFAGHSFLVFQNESQTLDLAEVVEFSNSLEFNAEKIGYENSFLKRAANTYSQLNKTSATQSFFYSFSLEHYRSNRNINLFELNLSSEELKLLKDLTLKKVNQIKNENDEYNVLDNNCLTIVIDLINSSVREEKRKIPLENSSEYFWLIFNPKLSIKSEELLNRIPYFLNLYISNYNIIKGHNLYFPSKLEKKREFLLLALDKLRELNECYLWDKKVVSALSIYFMHFQEVDFIMKEGVSLKIINLIQSNSIEKLRECKSELHKAEVDLFENLYQSVPTENKDLKKVLNTILSVVYKRYKTL